MKAPKPLKEGDKIAIISPAGALHDVTVVDSTKVLLKQWGLDVIVMPHTQTQRGYYSGTAEERFEDLEKSLIDNDIKAILCSYGGYGCVHLAKSLAPLIKRYPKWIIGMSDCSVLHAVCLSQGVMAIHSSQCNHLSKHPDSFSANMLKKILFGELPIYRNTPHELDIYGTAKGVIVGGNLSVLSALIGTEYDIFKDGTILFIEDIGEQPYRIERMIYQLELAGVLSRIKGLIVGEFNGFKNEKELKGETYELIHNIIKKHRIPVCFGFPVGHSDENVPLIEGAECCLTVNKNGTELKFHIQTSD